MLPFVTTAVNEEDIMPDGERPMQYERECGLLIKGEQLNSQKPNRTLARGRDSTWEVGPKGHAFSYMMSAFRGPGG